MGDRYTLIVICPKCGLVDDDVYYAPTCGFITWECEKCKTVVDLEKYSGIDAEGCASTDSGVKAVQELKKKIKEKNERLAKKRNRKV